MTDWTFPTAFSSWTPNDDGPEDRAWKRTYASGRLTMGPETAAFEEEIAVYHGRRHAIAVNSGSSANLVAVAAAHYRHPELRTTDVHHSVRSLTPAIAWATTYAPLVQHTFGISIADIDDTWCAPTGNRAGGLKGAPLMIAVPILGNPAYLEDWQKLAGWAGATAFIEDNCESLGARTTDGRLTGTFGDLSTGSGFYSHQLSAIELGWILTDDDELARLCRLLRNHGNDGWGSDDFDYSYNFTLFGYNLRPAEINCAVAREQLKRLDAMIEVRRHNLEYFKGATVGLPIVHQRTVGKPSPFGLAFRCEDNAARKRLVAALCGAGIDCRLPTGGSFRKHPYAAPWADQTTPAADLIHDTGMFLGNAPRPIPELIDGAVRVMRNVL